MKVMCRRWSRAARAPAPAIEPMPPQARTSEVARRTAELVADAIGHEHVDRPPVGKQEHGRSEQVAHSQACARTKARPSRSSRNRRRAHRASLPGLLCGVGSKIAAAETTKVQASRTNAQPVPTDATSQPPIAGPTSRNANGRMNWSSSSPARKVARDDLGTSDMKAGPKKASPVPKTTARAIRCQSSIAPVSERTAMVAAATPRDYVGGDHDAAPLEPVGDDASDEDEGRARASHASPTSERAVGESESS